MKSSLFVIFVLFSLISCEDIQVNEVGMQALVNDRLYISTDARASRNMDGSVTIQGVKENESMTLSLAALKKGAFKITGEGSNYAVFDQGGNIYTTKPDGSGEIIISEINAAKKTLSGTFKFNAFLQGVDTMYVSSGVMYNISYAIGEIAIPVSDDSFRAKVDDIPFLPFIINGRSTPNRILLSGSTVTTTIIISVPTTVGVGTTTLPTTGFNATYQNTSGPEEAVDGQINILEHNTAANTIRGTFSFSTNLSEITEGSFNLTY